MTSGTLSRRQLRFDDLDAIAADVRHLHEAGYDRVGNWDLAQICDHLGLAMKGSMVGFPAKVPWPLRLIGKHLILPKILTKQRMKSGVKLPAKYLPKPGQDEEKVVRQFCKTIDLLNRFEGSLHPHPFFGSMTRDQWWQLHRVHSAHHLSFLIPKDAAG